MIQAALSDQPSCLQNSFNCCHQNRNSHGISNHMAAGRQRRGCMLESKLTTFKALETRHLCACEPSVLLSTTPVSLDREDWYYNYNIINNSVTDHSIITKFDTSTSTDDSILNQWVLLLNSLTLDKQGTEVSQYDLLWHLLAVKVGTMLLVTVRNFFPAPQSMMHGVESGFTPQLRSSW